MLYPYSNADANANADAKMLMPRFSNDQILLRLIEKEVKSSHNLKDNNNTKDNLKNNNNTNSDTKSKASIDDLIESTQKTLKYNNKPDKPKH